MTIASQITDVLRRVDMTGSGHVLTISQTYRTSVEDLWDACTTPERLERWFEAVEGDLHRGGRYRLADSGTEGTIEQCDAPRSLGITWEYGDDISRVLLSIDETDAGAASLTIRHLGDNNEHWQAYGPAAGGSGWDTSLLGLALHLENDPPMSHLVDLMASDDGAQFLRATGAAWAAAHEAADADVEDAAVRAERAIERNIALWSAGEDPHDSLIRAEITHRFDATPEEVFDAWLDADLVSRWMSSTLKTSAPGTELLTVEIDARVGGAFRFIDSRDPDQDGPTGTYLEIDRPRRLSFTWLPEEGEHSIVTIHIRRDDDGAILTLVHEMEAKWEEYLDDTRRAWTRMTEQIELLLR